MPPLGGTYSVLALAFDTLSAEERRECVTDGQQQGEGTGINEAKEAFLIFILRGNVYKERCISDGRKTTFGSSN
jgi:hypothetical protein